MFKSKYIQIMFMFNIQKLFITLNKGLKFTLKFLQKFKKLIKIWISELFMLWNCELPK